MKYYKYRDEYSEIQGGYTYLETDKGVVFREVTVNGNDYIASNVQNPYSGHLGLSEGKLNYDDIDDVLKISESDFENVWESHLSNHLLKWQKTKTVHKVESSVRGDIERFYPQGVIVNLGDSILGLANYEECKASTKPEFMYTKQIVTGIVNGYDETNQWILIASPQVHEERISR